MIYNLNLVTLLISASSLRQAREPQCWPPRAANRESSFKHGYKKICRLLSRERVCARLRGLQFWLNGGLWDECRLVGLESPRGCLVNAGLTRKLPPNVQVRLREYFLNKVYFITILYIILSKAAHCLVRQIYSFRRFTVKAGKNGFLRSKVKAMTVSNQPLSLNIYIWAADLIAYKVQ